MNERTVRSGLGKPVWIGRAAALLIALVVILAGCGSTDDSDGSFETKEGTPSSSRKARFVEEASAVCARREEMLRRKISPSAKVRLSEELPRDPLVSRLDEVTLPAIAAQVAAIRRLNIPLGDLAEIEAILDRQEEAIVQLSAFEEVRSFGIVEIHFAEVDRLLEDHGLSVCTAKALGR
jgi:hypothetical protein